MSQTRVASAPIINGTVTLEALRDFVEATDDQPESAKVLVLADELQYQAES